MITRQAQNRERREKEENTEEIEDKAANFNILYREAVCNLMYLANATRPDILHAVNIPSRHQIIPIADDWKMVEQVLQYLSGTKTLGII